jgi:hypothetical protein
MGASAALALLLAVGGVEGWRAWQLAGLPATGHPFDLHELLARDIPEDENAFTYYREATRGITPFHQLQGSTERVYEWDKADPQVRTWVNESNQAMEIWKQGAEKSKAMYHPPRALNYATALPVTQTLRDLAHLALLEGSRLEGEGDMQGAWTWYRALLRCSRHSGQNGCQVERFTGLALHGLAAERIDHWAADPRVTAQQLRQAEHDVAEAEMLTVPVSETLKLEYLVTVRTLDDRRMLLEVMTQSGGPSRAATWRRYMPFIQSDSGLPSWYLANEPERTRRVVQHIFANELAHCDKPPAARPKLLRTSPIIFERDSASRTSRVAVDPPRLSRLYDQSLLNRLELPWAWRMASLKKLDEEREGAAKLLRVLSDQRNLREQAHKPPRAPQVPEPFKTLSASGPPAPF